MIISTLPLVQNDPVALSVGPILKAVIGHPDANHNAKDFVIVVNALCGLMGEERRRQDREDIQVWTGVGYVHPGVDWKGSHLHPVMTLQVTFAMLI